MHFLAAAFDGERGGGGSRGEERVNPDLWQATPSPQSQSGPASMKGSKQAAITMSGLQAGCIFDLGPMS